MSLHTIATPHLLRLEQDTLWLGEINYRPLQELGRGKSAVSWLYQRTQPSSEHPLHLVLKRYCPTEHQTIPFAQALEFELCSYDRLQQAGIAHPRLLGYSKEHYCLAKTFVDGRLISDLLVHEGLDDRHFQPIFQMASQLQQAGFHIDFFPTNFVLNTQGLHYIDYEAHPYNEEWNFANWGIFYWLNAEGMRRFLQTGDACHINKPGQPKPWDAPFMRQRESLLRRLG